MTVYHLVAALAVLRATWRQALELFLRVNVSSDVCREAAADYMFLVSGDGVIVTAEEDNSNTIHIAQNLVEETV